MNTKEFAETIHKLLRSAGFQSYIMFSKMKNEERDATIQRFRNQEIQVLITTNMVARGIDVPETQLVINYDVPAMRVPGSEDMRVNMADPETYLHRIGRTGRFATQGIALTLYDRDVDEKYLDEIADHYQMHDLIKTLDGPDQLKEALKAIQE